MTSVLMPSLPTLPARAARPRLGFLGLGWIGRSRLDVLARAGVGTVSAIADPAADRARTAAAAHPDALLVGSLAEMLDLGLDGVVIATPSGLHAEQVMAALRRGLAVFCQKPLACSADDARAIVALAREHDALLAVDLSYRWARAMREVRALVASGDLGRIFAVDAVFHNAYGPDKGWCLERRLAGGGCAIDLGTHLVDLALWTLGFPEVRGVRSHLWAGAAHLAPGDEAIEDFALASLELETGALVRIACSWGASIGADARVELLFHGEHGAARFHNLAGSFYDFAAEHLAGTGVRPLAEPPDEWPGRALVEWAHALGAGCGFDPVAEQHVAVAQVMDAIYGR